MPRQHLDVVFAIDDNYAAAAAVVAHSIRTGLRDQRTGLRFHVIDGGLSPAGRRKLTASLGRVGQPEIHTVANRLELPGKIKHWTSAALGRLHVGAVLPEDVDRAVYLDVDTLVLGDLSEFFDLDLAGNTIGACINEVGADRSWTLADTAIYSDHGAQPPGYFNSGVLLIDLDRWRADDVTDQVRQIYLKYGGQLRTHDQDVLNIVFSGRWTRLPEKWNKLVEHSVHGRFGAGRLDYLTRRDGIVHFIGGIKPWNAEFPANSLRELYAEYSTALAS